MPGAAQSLELPGTREWKSRSVHQKVPVSLPRRDCLGKPWRSRGGWQAGSRHSAGCLAERCLDTVYVYQEEHHLTAAVLLNAADPGATPPPLPGMKPLQGHPGLFEAPGPSGEMAARRIPGAWLVVGEGTYAGSFRTLAAAHVWATRAPLMAQRRSNPPQSPGNLASPYSSKRELRHQKCLQNGHFPASSVRPFRLLKIVVSRVRIPVSPSRRRCKWASF
jgi:hypothetical protein